MKTTGERVRQARVELGLSGDELAKRAGYKNQSAIGNIENRDGGTGGRRLPQIARALNVSTDWLLNGPDSDNVPFLPLPDNREPLGNPMAPKPPLVTSYQLNDTDAANIAWSPQPAARKIPVISYIQAGSWADLVDSYAMGDGLDVTYSWDTNSPRAFALRVRGDSMTNPGGSPSFTEGMTIVVDPDIDARPGDFVVVRCNGDTEATFKRLQRDGDQYYLVPLNRSYPTMAMPPDSVICGVVVGASFKTR